MKVIHTFISHDDTKITEVSLLTQVLSALSWKHHNPSDTLWLYTNTKTLSEYKSYGIDKLYDKIDTDVLDRYPSNINNKVFWATPKLWVMKNQTTPFVNLDTDFVFHKKLQMIDDSVVFLHQENPTTYPFPTKLEHSDDFKWSEIELSGFLNSLPVNTALSIWTDISFLQKYLDRYFEFVTNNEGRMTLTEDEVRYTHKNGAQLTSEQWLLSAMILLEQQTNENFSSKSLLPILSHIAGFKPQDYNMPLPQLMEGVNNSMFHLWNSKSVFEMGNYSVFTALVKSLTSSISNLIPSLNDDILYDILESITDSVRKVPDDSIIESNEETQTQTTKSD